MEPLEPNDPLWKVLGKARPVEPRSNFTQNVLRAARQTPQTRGWWAGLAQWLSDNPPALSRVALGAATAAVVVALAVMQFRTASPSSDPTGIASVSTSPASWSTTVAEPPLLAVETQLESVDQMSVLLALEDTSTLTDSEINFLLY